MSAANFAKSCLAADALLQGKLIRTLEVSQRAGAIIPELPNKQVRARVQIIASLDVFPFLVVAPPLYSPLVVQPTTW